MQYSSYKTSEQQEASSEAEFEKEMASEVMSAMKLMVSSAAASLAAAGKEKKRKRPTDSIPSTSSRQKATTVSQPGNNIRGREVD